MKESLFRKESLNKINSPGQLNRYIRVAEPGAWLVLGAIVLLLIGVLVWGIFGTIETTVNACVLADAEGAVCYVSAQDAQRIEPGMEVEAGNAVGKISALSEGLKPAGSEVALQLEIAQDGLCLAAELDMSGLTAGLYEAEVIVERISPISFVLQ